ncbi:hypothetical protein OUZ56_031342 [Daphnia magna]|uniref:Uncharacterized protein n=1 Tax=Daphnia magna TaxID=35525 RepID=A0ABQ9ZUG2_9CRUS|nr:hypothetical protein OUZ56_031342 [Daphnia magna]
MPAAHNRTCCVNISLASRTGQLSRKYRDESLGQSNKYRRLSEQSQKNDLISYVYRSLSDNPIRLPLQLESSCLPMRFGASNSLDIIRQNIG